MSTTNKKSIKAEVKPRYVRRGGELALTPKQKKFADALLDDPTLSGTKAAIAAYDANPNSARALASENLAKPSIIKYLELHASDAEHTMFEVMNDSKALLNRSPGYAAVAKSAASDILDRVYGKPTQRIETKSESVVISIDLSDDKLISGFVKSLSHNSHSTTHSL